MYFLSISLSALMLLTAISAEKCYSENGIVCDCSLGKVAATISNCIRIGGWSTWSKWSKCREGVRKRRRRCNNPVPIGSICEGPYTEKKECAMPIAEYLFGTWSSWNSWSRCDCDRNLRQRSRFCRGSSCEGCEKQSEDCPVEECEIIRKWSQWTEWMDYDNKQIRYSGLCSSPNSKNLNAELRMETRIGNGSNIWSEWRVDSGVAYRFRPAHHNSNFQIEHHLISRSASNSIPIYIFLPVSCFCIIIGFLLQFLISRLLNCCRRKTTYLSYSFDSNPINYPSHLYRPQNSSHVDESYG